METSILKAGETVEVAGETYLLKSESTGSDIGCSGCHFSRGAECRHPKEPKGIGCNEAKVIFTKPTTREKISIQEEQKATNQRITKFKSAEEILLHLANGLSVINKQEGVIYKLIDSKIYSIDVIFGLEICNVKINLLLDISIITPYYEPEWYEVKPFKPQLCWVYDIIENITLLRRIKAVEIYPQAIFFDSKEKVRPFRSDLYRVTPLTKEEITTLFIDNLEN